MGSVRPDSLVTRFERARALEHLDGFAEIGCTAFDLAASYQVGGTERLFGHWIHARKNRSTLFLITKGAHPFPVVAPHRLTARAVENDLDDSLRRLQTDYVDLYLLHRDDPEAALEPVVETLHRAFRAGKIRAWGVSNFTHERVRAIANVAKDLPKMAASSPHFSLFSWEKPPFLGCVSIAGDEGAKDFYAREKIAVLAWSPLGSGFAAGEKPRAYANEANDARLRRCEELGKKYRASAAQIALAFLFAQPFDVHAVVAASSPKKMRLNLEAASIEITKDDARWLENGQGPAP